MFHISALPVWITLLLLLSLISFVFSAGRYDCCLSKYSSFGESCENGVVYDNVTYTCSRVVSSCPSCLLTENISSTSCYQCCVPTGETCSYMNEYNYVFSSSWVLLFIIFAGSCCCCSVVFLSAEHNRMKEGITFREAYLVPIPYVPVDFNFSEALPEWDDFMLKRKERRASMKERKENTNNNEKNSASKDRSSRSNNNNNNNNNLLTNDDNDLGQLESHDDEYDDDEDDEDHIYGIPTVIANPQTSIDIPVAEPTENSNLLGPYVNQSRDFFWD